MKLSTKKDVRRPNTQRKAYFQLNFLSAWILFFRSLSVFSKESRHKIKKFQKSNNPNNYSESSISNSSKDYGVKPLHQKAQHTTKRSSLLNFMALASIILTSSTLFYFYEFSTKIISKKEMVLDLYKKYQSIKTMNEKSKIMLSALNKSGEINGQLMLIVDTDNTIKQKTKEAVGSYLKNQSKRQEQLSYTGYTKILLWALIMMIGFIILRMTLLLKYKSKLDFSISLIKT